jgi:ADP-heptose:LPS heptosyltransferase
LRLLFITSNRIGDAVLSTGVLARLLERHPGARVTVACGPVAAPLFSAVPGLDRVLPMTKGRRGAHWWELWRATVGTRWEVVVDLRASLIAWLVPARRRIVLRPVKTPEHRVVQLGRLLGDEPPPAPTLWISPEQDAAAAALLPGAGPVLGVGPTANWIGKQWPADNFAAAVRRLTAPDGLFPAARVAVFGAPSERDTALPVLEAIPVERRIDLVGTVDLPTVAACMRRCSLYLGNDSGLMHLAAAAGIPTLGLFGPSPEVNYAPWGRYTAVVRGPRSYREIVDDPAFDHLSGRCYMDSLTVDAVVAAAGRLWRSRHAGAEGDRA